MFYSFLRHDSCTKMHAKQHFHLTSEINWNNFQDSYISEYSHLGGLRGLLKICFYGLIFYILIVLIKLCKIQYLNLDQALLFSRNQVVCLKNWKLWRAPTTTDFNNFFWNFAHICCLIMSTKRSSRFFYFV